MTGEFKGSNAEYLLDREINLPRGAAEVILGFLEELSEDFPLDKPVPPITPGALWALHEARKTFKTSLEQETVGDRVHVNISSYDALQVAGLAGFFVYGGDVEVLTGEKTLRRPYQPLDLALFDLNEAIVRAGGQDNRDAYERLLDRNL